MIYICSISTIENVFPNFFLLKYIDYEHTFSEACMQDFFLIHSTPAASAGIECQFTIAGLTLTHRTRLYPK